MLMAQRVASTNNGGDIFVWLTWKTFFIKDTQTDPYCAIDRAMQRASRSVTRKIAQHHKRQKRPKKTERVDEVDQNALTTLNNDD